MQKIDPPPLLQIFKLPDLFTLLALFSGALSVYLILVTEQVGWGMFSMLMSSMFDMIDGLVATKLGLQRKFGEYLDFMVDTVVYIGFVPIICFAVGVTQWTLLFAFMVVGCVRHARQLAYPNIKRQGVSTTTAAGAVPTMYLVCYLTGGSPSLIIGGCMILLTVGMLVPFPTTFYDRLKSAI